MRWRALKDRRLQALRALPELSRFSERQLRSLLPYLGETSVPPGQRLAKAGDPCAQYVVVLEGELEACNGSGPRLLSAGTSAGWKAMWERGNSDATLETASEARLLVIGRADFRAVRALALSRT
jgi:CRP-like cAMP-binding protein